MTPRARLVTGTLFALLAGLMWGLVFVAPLLLPDYPAALQSFARYLAARGRAALDGEVAPPLPDATTLATGDAGKRVACGVIGTG